MTQSVQLIQGNAAIAKGAFYAGARFYGGYPITPSSEIAEICSKELPKLGGTYMQMEDEIASMGAIIGASLAGVKSFTATSGPGFSLMQENLGVAMVGEVPLVVIDVQRVGPSTGLATKPAQADFMQIRWGRHGDQMPICLCPATVSECFSLMVEAFNLSEKYRCPVIFAPDEIVGHMRENITFPEDGEIPVIDRKKVTCSIEEYKPFDFSRGAVAPLASYGSDYVFHVTSSMHGENGYGNNVPENAKRRISQLHTKIMDHRDDIVRVKAFDIEDCEVLIITAGSPTRAAREAARLDKKEGIKTGVLQLQTIWPFADKEIKQAAVNAKKIVVPEMNYSGQLADEISKLFDNSIPILKVNSCNGVAISPEDIRLATRGYCPR